MSTDDHRRGLVALLAYCGTLPTIMMTATLPLFVQIADDYGISLNAASWIATVALLAGAVANGMVGRLGDMYGNRRMLLVMMAMLATGCAMSAVANGLPLMLAGRTLQGVSMGTAALGISAARDALPASRITPAIALISATIGLGAGLGIPLAGIVADGASWRAFFWLMALLGAIGFVGVWRLVPASRTAPDDQRFDLAGGIWLALILVAALLPITKAPAWGWTSGTGLGLFAAAAVAAVVWLRFEAGRAVPVVNLTVMRQRPMVLASIASAALGFAMYCNHYGAISQLQLSDSVRHGFGLSAVVIGLVMLPGALMMGLVSVLSAKLTTARGPRSTLMLGSLAIAAAFALRVILMNSVVSMAVGIFVVNIGIGMTFGALPSVVIEHAPRMMTAEASSLNALARLAGSAVSSAVVAAVLESFDITIGSATVPGMGAFRFTVLLGAGASLLAGLTSFLLPITPRPEASPEPCFDSSARIRP